MDDFIAIFDLLSLWLGRILICLFLGYALILCISKIWNYYLIYVWYNFKHLIPRWQKSENWYSDVVKMINEESDWGCDKKISRKGNLVKLVCSNHPFGTRTMFIKIQK